MKFCIALALMVMASLASQIWAQYSKSFAGPYTLLLQAVEDCPNNDSLPYKLSGNKIRKFNRTTFYLFTNFSASAPFSDDIELRYAFSTFGNGGWSSVQMEQSLGPACTAMWTIVPGTMKSFMEAIGKKECPIEPGNYPLKNFVLDTNINWPLLPYGKYRCEWRFYLGGELVGCKRMLADCVPKRELRIRKG